MTATGPGFSFQVFGSHGWVRLEGTTHVAGATSDERRTRLVGTCRFQPAKGPVETWQAESHDVSRAALEAFAVAAQGGAPYPISLDEMVQARRSRKPWCAPPRPAAWNAWPSWDG